MDAFEEKQGVLLCRVRFRRYTIPGQKYPCEIAGDAKIGSAQTAIDGCGTTNVIHRAIGVSWY